MTPDEYLIDRLIEAAIVAKGYDQGRLIEARLILLELGTIGLGQPSKDTVDCLHGIGNVVVLQDIILRVRHVNSWHELLAEG
jgi:hypothetical protein